MRSIILAMATLALATAASSATPAGPYKLDKKGNCHAANGQMVAKSNCATPASNPAPQHCKDPKTQKFTKCSAPGAVPA